MTLKQALSRAKAALSSNNIEDASLESELLLRHTLDIGRVQLYLDLDQELDPEDEKVFWKYIERRLNGEPSAYITGHREFFGIDFYVEPSVFIPRPETELLVEKSLNLAQQYRIATIAEIGTGSGAIAITLALRLPQIKIHAIDISAPALELAARNSRKHCVEERVTFIEGDMLTPLPEPVDLIIANLPYVEKGDISGHIEFEPSLALNGGTDGLQKIHQLCQRLDGKLNSEGHLLLEVGQGQAGNVATYLKNLYPMSHLEVLPDLAGIERAVCMSLAP